LTATDADCTGGADCEAAEVAVIVRLGLFAQRTSAAAMKPTVYVTVDPLAVLVVAPKLPQFEDTGQIADQVTPPGATSFVTTALKFAAVPAVMGFADALTFTEIGGTIVT
jgi:hypothetical protein